MHSKSNKIYSRYKFLSRSQKEGEAFKQYSIDLKMLTKNCDYIDINEMIHGAIVFGMKNYRIYKKYIEEGTDLTLESVVNIARMQGVSRSQLQTMSIEDKTVHVIHKKGDKCTSKE